MNLLLFIHSRCCICLDEWHNEWHNERHQLIFRFEAILHSDKAILDLIIQKEIWMIFWDNYLFELPLEHVRIFSISFIFFLSIFLTCWLRCILQLTGQHVPNWPIILVVLQKIIFLWRLSRKSKWIFEPLKAIPVLTISHILVSPFWSWPQKLLVGSSLSLASLWISDLILSNVS